MSEPHGATTTLPGASNLRALLPYQEGAIVSRVMLKNKAGSTTLFAFDRGEGLSEHTSPFEALLIGVDGEADITIDGQPFRVKDGDAITLPANHPHAVRAVSPFKMLLVMIRG
jgi:quercetin dioxygenase-like cupin family protein